jgi:hypothetical protein
VATSAGGEAASGKGNGGDNDSWVDTNFTEPKNNENLTDETTLVGLRGVVLGQP